VTLIRNSGLFHWCCYRLWKPWVLFLLPRCWPRGKCSGPSTSLSLTLLLSSILVILAPNWMLSLDSRIYILKGRILAMPQSTLITSNQSLLKNNLWPLYKLLFSSFLLSAQLQSWIWTLYTKTFFQLSLVTQLLQNTFLYMADGLRTQMVFFSLIIEFMYYLLVIYAYMLSSIIMITFLLDTSVKTKHWN